MAILDAATRVWPEPYLQPHDTMDCELYAAAYIARVLGHPEVTAEDVRPTREKGHPSLYAASRFATPVLTLHASWTPIWWMGPGAQSYVRSMSGQAVGYATVHRRSDYGHAVVVLESDDDGVLLMDPWSGFVRDPWDWFLGIGAGHGHSTAHRVEAWYVLPAGEVVARRAG